MREHLTVRIVAVLACSACVFVGSDAAAQFRKGFAQQMFEVTLTRKRPPRVYLMKTAIDVRVTTQGQHAGMTERLASAIETKLVGNDPRLRPEKERPDVVILCQVGQVGVERGTETRTRSTTKQVGTKQVWNAEKKEYEESPVYRVVSEKVTSVVVTGRISVSYQARDQASSTVLDSETVSPVYRKEFPEGSVGISDDGVEQELIALVTQKIVPRLTPTSETITVALGRPSDAVDALNKLAEAGLWSRMAEQLESMPAMKDAGKDAYRLYNVGVAYEAMGYQSDDLAASRKYLEHAAVQYGKSLELKPDEKYFREPQTRISSALAAYKTLEDQIAAYQRESPEPPIAVDRGGGARAIAPPRDAGPLDNAAIAELVKSGLDEQNLIAAIEAAPSVAFDLSPAGLKELLGRKVSNRIITAMRTRQGATTGRAPKVAPR